MLKLWLPLPFASYHDMIVFFGLFHRPVILVGLFSRPTSVDLGMVVNQLNVTAPHASLVWQSLILENAAPGVHRRRWQQQQQQQQIRAVKSVVGGLAAGAGSAGEARVSAGPRSACRTAA
jgi:hypothetical protein